MLINSNTIHYYCCITIATALITTEIANQASAIRPGCYGILESGNVQYSQICNCPWYDYGRD